MKKLFIIIIIFISFQTWAKADDIRDFQIGGISIGDSLLDYFTEEEINNASDNSYDATKFITRTFLLKGSYIYDFIQISFKPSEKKIIHGINGVVDYENNFQQCHKPMKKIVSELTSLFPSAKKKDWGKYKFSKGHYFPITFDLNDLSRAMVACYNWNEESNTIDSLKVTLYSEEYQIHLSKQDQ